MGAGASQLARERRPGGADRFYQRRAPRFWEIRGYHTHVSRTGALFAMEHNGWDHALKVTADGAGPNGPPGADLLRRRPPPGGLAPRRRGALWKSADSPGIFPGSECWCLGGHE